MKSISEQIEETLLKLFGDTMLYGYSQLDNSDKTVVVMMKRYYKDFVRYNEQEYHEMMIQIREDLNNQVKQFTDFLDANNIGYIIPDDTQKDEISLLADISFKHHALKSGLGFMGKNDLFINYKYGPRIRIKAIIIDAVMLYHEGLPKSECGDCNECVKACPYGCLTNTEWNEDIKRYDIIDYHRCNQIRTRLLKDRKHTCGYCLLACPVGNFNVHHDGRR